MLLDIIPASSARDECREEREMEYEMSEPNMDYCDILQQPEPLFLSCDSEVVGNDDDDVISMDPSVRTPISTPIDTTRYQHAGFTWGQGQGQTQYPFPPYLKFIDRQNTASSLASSVSDLHATKNSTIPCNNFTPQFLRLLLEVYYNVCSDPTVTPFDTENPPCGILNRVSKIAVEISQREGVDIGYERNSWLLTLVRHRLLEEVRRDCFFSRDEHTISIPQLVPRFMEGAESSEMPSPDHDFLNNGWNFMAALRSSSSPCKNPIRTKSGSPLLLLDQSILERNKSDYNSSGMSGLTPTNSETNLSDAMNLSGDILSDCLTRQHSDIDLTVGQTCSDTNSPLSPSPISPIASIEDRGIALRKRREFPRFRR